MAIAGNNRSSLISNDQFILKGKNKNTSKVNQNKNMQMFDY
jgi:hypothetical protein